MLNIPKNLFNLHSDLPFLSERKRRNQLASEPNYHTKKYFSKNLLAMEIKKTKENMNKPVYLSMSTLDISKTLMYEFWYNYIKPKKQEKAKLCYKNTESFIIHIKTEGFDKDIVNYFKK